MQKQKEIKEILARTGRRASWLAVQMNKKAQYVDYHLNVARDLKLEVYLEMKSILLGVEKTGFENTIIPNRFPILSTIYAGKSGMLLNEQPIGYATLPYHKTSNCFVLIVEGDSMQGTVENGDMVLVDMDSALQNGCIVAVRLKSGEQYIKKYTRQNGSLILSSNNPAYHPMLIKDDKVEVIYRVVRIVRNV